MYVSIKLQTASGMGCIELSYYTRQLLTICDCLASKLVDRQQCIIMCTVRQFGQVLSHTIHFEVWKACTCILRNSSKLSLEFMRS